MITGHLYQVFITQIESSGVVMNEAATEARGSSRVDGVLVGEPARTAVRLPDKD